MNLSTILPMILAALFGWLLPDLFGVAPEACDAGSKPVPIVQPEE